MFYVYHQNNSGGSFVEDAEAGITDVVIIEADTPELADVRAERIGIYFDGDGDCACCGQRWSPASDWDASEAPEIYGIDVSNGTYEPKFSPMKWTEVPAYIHYKDDRIVTVEWA